VNRRPLIALVMSAATVVTLAVPAGAAVPKTAPDATVPCPAPAQGVARVWYSHGHLAAKNPCSQWFVFWGEVVGPPPIHPTHYNVAPGAHFNARAVTRDHQFGYRGFLSEPQCSWSATNYTVLRGSHGKMQPTPPCA
jgi:hypothetical protein